MGHRVRVLSPLRTTQITYSHRWEVLLLLPRRRRRRLTKREEDVGGQSELEDFSNLREISTKMVAREDV